MIPTANERGEKPPPGFLAGARHSGAPLDHRTRTVARRRIGPQGPRAGGTSGPKPAPLGQRSDERGGTEVGGVERTASSGGRDGEARRRLCRQLERDEHAAHGMSVDKAKRLAIVGRKN